MRSHDPSPAPSAQRRTLLIGVGALATLTLGSGGPSDVWAATVRPSSLTEQLRNWQRTGGVLLIRHAATESGLGDPPGFVIGQCRTQRNLSEAGRQASRALGEWLRDQQFQADRVRSSQWCRCQDTARLAFGRFEDWPALNITFAGQGDPLAQQQAMRERLLALPAGHTEVWVTHQVNMTGLTGAYPGMGEGFWVDRQGRLSARGDLAA